MPRPRPTIDGSSWQHYERLADKLATTTQQLSGDDRLGMPLGVAAFGLLFLGGAAELEAAGIDPLDALAEHDDPLAMLRTLYAGLEACRPFLAGHLDPLTGWLDRPSPKAAAAVRACAAALGQVDLAGMASLQGSSTVGADLLGTLYTLLRSPSGRRGSGAFYTPASVAKELARVMLAAETAGEPEPVGRSEALMARLVLPKERTRILEPACGSGILLIAAAQAMRDAGRDPTTCCWTAIDIDPVAVALCGINAVVYGLGRCVHLICGDALRLMAGGAA